MVIISAYIIVFDQNIPEVTFAAEELNKVIAKVENEIQEASFRIIITTMDTAESSVLKHKYGANTFSSLSPQGYAIRTELTKEGMSCWIIGFDSVGAMYGVLDLSDVLKTEKTIKNIRNYEISPYIENRGIKFNIPLDARTPSYSDNSDSAQQNIIEMWSMDFWSEFLDEMAFNRFNSLSLWNLHPFPSMVKVPEYPDIALNDVKKTTIPIQATTRGLYMSTDETLNHLVTLKEMKIEDKICFWQDVMTYAKNRGIDVYMMTWNIFTYGIEGNQYGINDEQNNETTIDYFRASVRALLKTYPLLAGVGVTSGENMQSLESPHSDEEWLWRTYGKAVQDVKEIQPERKIRLIHRAHWASLSHIEEVFADYPDTLDFSYKYSQAHMYASVNPPSIHTDGFLDELPKDKKTWLTVRNDDYYMFRWGDPDFAREYILNMPKADQLAGFYMGPDGYIWGREFISTEPDSPRQTVIRKFWYSFLIWGKLSYQPNLSNIQFKKLLAYRFPEVSGEGMFEAWSAASRILPLVTSFHWEGNSLDFQWYPEACYSLTTQAKGFHTVKHFIEDAPILGSGLMSIRDYCDHLLNERSMKGITPVQVAHDLFRFAEKTLQYTSEMNPISNKELKLTIGDLQAMSWLGKYYAEKILGAVELCLADVKRQVKHRNQAIHHLQKASEYWREYAAAASNQYIPQLLNRLGYEVVDVKELQAQVNNDISIAKTYKV